MSQSSISRSNVARYATIAALIAGASLFATAAEALPPGVAPPWADQTTPAATPSTPATAATQSAPAATETTASSPQSASPTTNTSAAMTNSIEVPTYPAGGTTTPASPVSMRAGPNTSFPVIGTLRPGMPLQILASANHGWMQVQSPAGPGWVYGSYLAVPSSGGTEPAPAPPPEVIER